MVIVQILMSLDSLPLMILSLCWFGIALIIYLSVYEDRL